MRELKQYTDQQLLSMDALIFQITTEHFSQIRKWGVQTHSAFEWFTYTAEELGSLAKAIGEYEYRNGPKERIISEAIQVATLALKIAEMFEQLPPEKGE